MWSSLVFRSWYGPVALGLVALLVSPACKEPATAPPAAPAPGEWRSFEGTWSAGGDRRTIDIGPDRKATVLDLSGSILLVGERGLGAGFQARSLTYADDQTGVGHAVWTDERGDRIFSALRGTRVATGSHLVGTFTGGTGRWRGLTGEYAFDWTWVVETEGRLDGRAVGLRGRARIVAPEVAP